MDDKSFCKGAWASMAGMWGKKPNQTTSVLTIPGAHSSACTALTDLPRCAKLAKPMCQTKQTLPPASCKHLGSACSCQHSQGSREPPETCFHPCGEMLTAQSTRDPRKVKVACP